MISDFRDDWLRKFFVDNSRPKELPADLEGTLFRKLQLIDDANEDKDLRVPPGNRFEKKRGNLEGHCSIRVDVKWRLVFVWNADRGEASDLYMDDHSYR